MQITRHTHDAADGTLIPKKDENGLMFMEIRCQNVLPNGATCNGWLCDLYVRDGRVRLRCKRSDCGKITVMVFRPKKRKRSNQKKITK